MKIFVAGATGVIGRVVVSLLVRAGHEVTGMTRSATGAGELRRQGATLVVVDAFDAAGLGAAVASAAPAVVVHQLTALPDDLDRLSPEGLTAALRANARMRVEGTQNLVAAATRAGRRGSSPRASRGPMRRDPSPTPRMTPSI